MDIDLTLKTPPKRAVEPDGTVNFGYYLSEFPELNLLDVPLFGNWRTFRKFRLKEWQHVCMISPTHWVSLAMVNTQYLNAAWCYVFDRRNGELREHKHNARPGAARIPRELWNDTCSIVLPGFGLRIHNHLAEKRHLIEIDIAGRNDLPAIKGKITAFESPDEVQPLIPLLPMQGGRVFYTHKVPTPIQGELLINDEKVSFERNRDFAIFDIHKVFYPFHTMWNWATFAGRDRNGALLGATLTRGSAFPADQATTENCLWHGNKLSLLGHADFSVPKNTLDKWTVKTIDSRCELEFAPEGQRAESIHLGPIVSDFRQPFGKFNGFIVGDDGTRHVIKDLFGCAEKHISAW